VTRAFEQVLGDARSGSEAAFAALYRSLAPAVLGFARGRGAPDPEDVVAETMTSVARNLGRFRGDEAAFRSWAFTIAYRRVVDDRRKAARRVSVRPLSDTEDWASASRSAETIVDELASGPVGGGNHTTTGGGDTTTTTVAPTVTTTPHSDPPAACATASITSVRAALRGGGHAVTVTVMVSGSVGSMSGEVEGVGAIALQAVPGGFRGTVTLDGPTLIPAGTTVVVGTCGGQLRATASVVAA
jgi:RNA polymerase sigma factor (sigma-70 family)